MSTDPVGNAIWAIIDEWFDFDGNLTGAKAASALGTTGTVSVSYETGLFGQELAPNSIATQALVNGNFQPSLTSHMCIGGWLDFIGSSTKTTTTSIAYDTNSQNEALSINCLPTGVFTCGMFGAGGSEGLAQFPGRTIKNYPITVLVTDSSPAKQSASSPQVIQISGNVPQLGRYFIVGQWNASTLELWMNGVLVATAAVQTPRNDVVRLFQAGNQFTASTTPCGLESLFYSTTHVLTSAQIIWLYNNGAGRQSSDLKP